MYCIFVEQNQKNMERTQLLNWLKKHQKPGVYHNGGFGFPSLQVNITESATGFSVTVFHNSKMETFTFAKSELL